MKGNDQVEVGGGGEYIISDDFIKCPQKELAMSFLYCYINM
jgi:hypothetical protein